MLADLSAVLTTASRDVAYKIAVYIASPVNAPDQVNWEGEEIFLVFLCVKK